MRFPDNPQSEPESKFNSSISGRPPNRSKDAQQTFDRINQESALSPQHELYPATLLFLSQAIEIQHI